jgi:hypothetical protein
MSDEQTLCETCGDSALVEAEDGLMRPCPECAMGDEQTRIVRDHSQPCEQHGLSGVHSYDVMTHPDGSTVAEFCPGGRGIVEQAVPWCDAHDASFVDFGYHVCLGMEKDLNKPCCLQDPPKVWRETQ